MRILKNITFGMVIAISPLAIYAQVLVNPSGGYIQQNAGSFMVGGNFTNDGTFKNNAGIVVFGASGDQRLEGSVPISFKKLTVNSGANATLNSAGQTLSRVLVSNGTLHVNGNLVLLSDASSTALVDGAGTGDILDTLYMQRYMDTAYGYKLIGTPFQSVSVLQLADYIDLLNTFPTLYDYEEGTYTYGWQIHIDSSATMLPLRGYSANFGSNFLSKTMVLRGVVNNGVQSRTLYNNNETYTQGFTLVSNPYPSPIDWTASSGWTKTNIDDAIYYFDNSDTNQYTGVYNSYINGVSSDGVANNLIPAMQGFFVHVSDGTYPVEGTLAMDNNVRVNVFSPFYHKPPRGDSRPLIRLSTKYTSEAAAHDATVIYFDEKADLKFEKDKDAIKLMNTGKLAPNVYVITPGANKLAISAMPMPEDSVTIIPLGVEVQKDDQVVFKAANINEFPYGLHAYFSDAQKGIVQDLTANQSYQVSLAAGKYESRFSIIFSKKDITHSALAANGLNAYSSNGKIFVNLNLMTGEEGELAIVNMSGQVVNRQKLTGYGYHEIPVSFASGVYILSFYSHNGVFSKKIPLQ